ncbi:hypothetical protein [Deinococcus hopiensis]|uniref:Uncharacterized protein n=1 Tax=Deinococcus hopiensis KR-140 TaxID=695939 RepID=A0A1W1UQ88_9DEIO|nr:hypothetical protein [Deinococcus hopiensis]SMB83308.1 hypothetical protein SAMN00790413_04347 [Deinococcus hopiensis KR-140]
MTFCRTAGDAQKVSVAELTPGAGFGGVAALGFADPLPAVGVVPTPFISLKVELERAESPLRADVRRA